MFDMKWAEGRTVTKARFCPGLPPGSSIASQKLRHKVNSIIYILGKKNWPINYLWFIYKLLWHEGHYSRMTKL